MRNRVASTDDATHDAIGREEAMSSTEKSGHRRDRRRRRVTPSCRVGSHVGFGGLQTAPSSLKPKRTRHPARSIDAEP